MKGTVFVRTVGNIPLLILRANGVAHDQDWMQRTRNSAR